MIRLRRRVLIPTVLLLALAGAGAWFGVPHLRAERHFRAGEAALAAHHPAKALGHFEACLKTWPTSAKAHLLAARSARHLGDYDAAERHLIECQRREPQPSDDSVLEWSLLRAENGALEKVEEFLRSAVDRGHPKSPLILEALAEGYLRMYRWFEAMRCVERWQDLEPANPAGWFLQGRGWQQVRSFTKAGAAYARVLELDPDHDDARLRLANALLENGDAALALDHLERLRLKQPKNPEILVRLGFAWNSLGRAEESSRVIDELLADQPNFAPALLARGQLELQADRAGEAERWFRRGLAVNPYDRQTHFGLHQALARQPDKKEAADAQERRMKEVEGLVERLIELSNRQMPKRPNDPKLHHETGLTLAGLGHAHLAVQWYLSALQCDPNYGPAHRSMAEVHDRAGNRDQAERHRRHADLAETTSPTGPKR